MPETKDGVTESAGIVQRLLRKPEWFEEKSFSRARIALGPNDYVDVVLLPGDLADRTLGLVADIGGALQNITKAGDAEAGMSVLLQALAPDTRQQFWALVGDALASCVSKAELTDTLKDIPSVVMPTTDMSAGERIDAAKALPLRMVVRIVVGLAVQSGNW